MKIDKEFLLELREQGLTYLSVTPEDDIRELLFEESGKLAPSAQTTGPQLTDVSSLPQNENLPELVDQMFEQGKAHVLEKMPPEMRKQWEDIEELDLRLHSA